MSGGPYAVSTATGSAWPQGRPTDPEEWSEAELNAWIDTQLRESCDFIHDWFFAAWSYYPDGARW